MDCDRNILNITWKTTESNRCMKSRKGIQNAPASGTFGNSIRRLNSSQPDHESHHGPFQVNEPQGFRKRTSLKCMHDYTL